MVAAGVDDIVAQLEAPDSAEPTIRPSGRLGLGAARRRHRVLAGPRLVVEPDRALVQRPGTAISQASQSPETSTLRKLTSQVTEQTTIDVEHYEPNAVSFFVAGTLWRWIPIRCKATIRESSKESCVDSSRGRPASLEPRHKTQAHPSGYRRASSRLHGRPRYKPDQIGWKDAKAALSELAAVGRARNVPVIVFLIPELHGLSQGNPFADVYRDVTAASIERGLTVVDLFPAFEGQSPEAGLWEQPLDAHQNAAAHGIMAKAMRQTMERRGPSPPLLCRQAAS